MFFRVLCDFLNFFVIVLDVLAICVRDIAVFEPLFVYLVSC